MAILRRSLAAFVLGLMPAVAVAGVFFNYSAPHDDLRANLERAWLVRVKPGDRAYFHHHLPDVYRGCPAATAACRTRAYVLPGDVLVAAYTQGAFTVVDYVSPGGTGTDGAIETSRLEHVAPTVPALGAWIGKWRTGGEETMSIRAARAPGKIQVEGEATYGASDPERVKRGAVNMGSLGGTVRPTGEWAGIIDDQESPRSKPQVDRDWAKAFPYQGDNGSDCQVRLRLLGPYLLAQDDGHNCGGMNVSFTGVYRRMAPRRH